MQPNSENIPTPQWRLALQRVALPALVTVIVLLVAIAYIYFEISVCKGGPCLPPGL
jgi:hypothetical protein